MPSQALIYTPRLREAVMFKCLAQGHEFHDRKLKPTLLSVEPSDLDSDALDYSAVVFAMSQT